MRYSQSLPPAPSSPLRRLCRWYQTQCDGDWEHAFGVRLSTLDNPGWRVKIDLADTCLELRAFDSLKIERSTDDWIHADIRTENGRTIWSAAGGPGNLEEMITLFIDWADCCPTNQKAQGT